MGKLVEKRVYKCPKCGAEYTLTVTLKTSIFGSKVKFEDEAGKPFETVGFKVHQEPICPKCKVALKDLAA